VSELGQELERMLGVPDVERLEGVGRAAERSARARSAARKLGVAQEYDVLRQARTATAAPRQAPAGELWHGLANLLDITGRRQWW